MAEKLFGTDGVRGEANTWPMTAELALRLGAAAGRHFRRDDQEHSTPGKDRERGPGPRPLDQAAALLPEAHVVPQ